MSLPRLTFRIAIFTLAVAAYGQQPDYHVTRDPFRDVYARSAFLHGHRHGYEEGFHAADQDLHLGRHSQINDKRAHIPKMQSFHFAYGDKGSFRRGYKGGFWAGYFDSYSGREFSHLPQSVSILDDSIPGKKQEVSIVPNPEFDSGAFEGYRAGSHDVSHFELRPGITKYAEDFCRKNLVRGTSIEFCSGYGSGYVLGKVDSIRKNGQEADNSVRVAAN